MNDQNLHDLNPQQYEAVTAGDGPLLIIAGAGSGKTRVITQRIAWLVRNKGARPWEIFAATFTNKAAEEMKRRVAQLLGEGSPRDFHIATFHSHCARILRREASAADLPTSFLICDEHDQVSAIKHVMRVLGISDKLVKPADAQYVINQCKMRMLSPQDAGQITKSNLEEQYVEIFEAYESYMRQNGAVDFEDLLLRVVLLLQKHPDICQLYQQRYRYVLVDEYQDTNAVQFELVRLLAGGHRNLIVVGDEDQSIYSWRGADISNLLEFQKHFPETRLIRLEQNYRSTTNILKAASGVIAHNTQRLGKNLFTAVGEGAPVCVLVARDGSSESHGVANAIQELARRGGYSYGDIAVFFRVGALSRSFEDRLRLFNIPYRVIGGVRFYDRVEIKDAISYLSVVQNPGNSIALLRIINTPKRGLGTKSTQKIIDYARSKNVTDFHAMDDVVREGFLSKAAERSLSEFLNQMEGWREFARTHRSSELLRRILDDTGYVEALGDPDSFEVRSRTDNLAELDSSIMLFEKENPTATLQDYLEGVSLMSATDSIQDGESSVSLMTLHSSKGLEYKVVFIVGMEDKIFPNARALLEAGNAEEERRLFYVGVTRAREILLLTRAQSRVWYGDVQFNQASPFLSEIPEDVRISMAADDFNYTALLRVAEPLVETAAAAPPIPSPASVQNPGPHQAILGKRVRHPILGEGVVAGVTGQGRNGKVLLQLDHGGSCQLLAQYANLQFIDET